MSNNKIYLSSPDVTDLEEEALVRAIRSGWIAPLGPEVDAFEAELAEYCGRSRAVALSSGTAALHLGLLTMGVGPGDLVLTSALTFAATTNAIVYTGAEPVFVDADESGNMNPDLLEQAFQTLESEGRSVKVVVPVDLLGKVVDHERISEIASRFGAVVLSDAAESLGATRNGKSAASFGVAAAVSFNGNKIMTTSGGGALLTDDEDFADQLLAQPLVDAGAHGLAEGVDVETVAAGEVDLGIGVEMAVDVVRKQRLGRQLQRGQALALGDEDEAGEEVAMDLALVEDGNRDDAGLDVVQALERRGLAFLRRLLRLPGGLEGDEQRARRRDADPERGDDQLYHAGLASRPKASAE